MTNEELNALVERLSEPWRREGFKPADMELAAAAIQQLRSERDKLLGLNPAELVLRNELAALRKKIDEAEPVAWHFAYKIGTHIFYWEQRDQPSKCLLGEVIYEVPLYTLEGIKK